MQTATPVLQLSDKPGLGDFPTYFWKSNHEALFLRHVARPGSIKRNSRFSRSGLESAGYCQPVIFNIDTGEETVPLAFDAEFSPLVIAQTMRVSHRGIEGEEINYRPPHCSLSPDGQWLVWISWALRSPTWIAAPLDGTRHRRWTQQEDRDNPGQWPILPPLWMRDNQRWVEMEQTYARNEGTYRFHSACVHSLEHPRTNREIIISERVDGLPLGLTQDDHVLVRHYESTNPVTQNVFYAYGLGAPQPSVRTYSAPLPEMSEVSDVALSPQGNRLAWVLRPTDEQNDRRKFATYKVWVSDLEGAGMQEISRQEGVTEPSESSLRGWRYFWPHSLAWTPDGKRVSYVYRDVLWTVPVD